MANVRKDGKGRVLHKGEVYVRSKGLYSFSYMDAFGKRKYLYSRTLEDLRDKETELQRNKLDRLESYAMAKADINYVFDRYMATKTELRSTTRTNYVYTYDRYVRKGFGKKRISDVRYSEVLTFYNALMEKGLSVRDGDRAFCIIDTDTNKEKQSQIDTACKMETDLVKVITSSPCFEEWFLCHYRWSTGYQTSSAVLDELKTFCPSYKKNSNIYPLINDKQGIAIKNAARLEQFHHDLGRSEHSVDCNPSSEMYKVIEFLIK